MTSNIVRTYVGLLSLSSKYVAMSIAASSRGSLPSVALVLSLFIRKRRVDLDNSRSHEMGIYGAILFFGENCGVRMSSPETSFPSLASRLSYSHVIWKH